MWMGVPVIVKEGNNFVSRMGASFMKAAGLSDWVAKDDEEYVKIAKEMASDRKKLYELKKSMRDKLLKSSAWDIDLYTRDFESSLQKIWKS